MNKIETKLFHGQAITNEYPEHLDWFLPSLMKSLNKILASVNVRIIGVHFDYSNTILSYKIVKEKVEIPVVKNIENILSLDELIHSTLHSIESKLIDSLNVSLTASRPATTSDAFRESNIILSLISTEALKPIKKFKDMQLKNIHTLHEGDYYLPIYDKEELMSVFNSIASLNPVNQIFFEIEKIDLSDEYVIVKISDHKKAVSKKFDIRDFDTIGIELNNFTGITSHRYILIRPDNDNIIYAFCNNSEILELEKHELISDNYL